jgi:hypothetical protein
MIVIIADCDIDDQKYSIANIAIDVFFWFQTDTDISSQIDMLPRLGNAAHEN